MLKLYQIIDTDKLSFLLIISEYCPALNLHTCPKALKELSYNQFVLPILDYASSIWDPYHQNLIIKLKMIQHKAARYIFNQPWRRNVRDSVSLLLQSLNWPSLQCRRESIHLILLYKIINQFLHIPSSYHPVQSPITATRSSNDKKFLHYQPNIDCYKFSFFLGTMLVWNRLPSDMVQATSIVDLKTYCTTIITCICNYRLAFMPQVGSANY